MLYLDHKYLGLASHLLTGFQRKSRSVYVFRCPKCGDSENRRSTHCYAFEADDKLRIFCHRCGWPASFPGFLKLVAPDLAREYFLEKFEDRRPARVDWDRIMDYAASAPVPVRSPDNALARLVPVPDLGEDHPAVELMRRRMIPSDRWGSFYHCDDFKGWARSIVPDRYKPRPNDIPEPRLIIPFEVGRKLIGFQGRSYSSSGIRYLTVCVDPGVPFLYNWDGIDQSRPIIAVEGPIDSVFLDNGTATAGGSVSREVAKTGLPASSFVIAYDNEPRSAHTIRKMRRALEEGFSVFVWPETVRAKDFNDWVLDGASRDLIMRTIRERTFHDLEADLAIESWKRIDA